MERAPGIVTIVGPGGLTAKQKMDSIVPRPGYCLLVTLLPPTPYLPVHATLIQSLHRLTKPTRLLPSTVPPRRHNFSSNY